MSVRSFASGWIRSLMRRAGREVVPYDLQHFPDLHRRRLMAAAGITLVLDVGGNLGQTGEELRHGGYTGRIVSFEPQNAPFQQLARLAAADGKWEARQCAVGDSKGSIEMNVSGTHWSSSILPMTGRHVSMVASSAYVGKETVSVCRLDDLFTEYAGPDDRVYLKVDTQGYEAPVIRGAGGSLQRIRLVQLELSFVPLYEGQAKYFELLAMMDAAAFDLVTIWPAFLEASTSHYLQADAIFERRAE